MTDELDLVPTLGPGQGLALVNGRVFTANRDNLWCSAVLIRDGHLEAVGSDEEILAAMREGDLRRDVGTRTVMPGIHDAHTHLLFSGLKFRYEARLDPAADAASIVKSLSECSCADHLSNEIGGWIVGGEINPFNFDGGLDRSFLDDAFPETPVFLYDYSIHHGFANTAALEAAGIDPGTPDPRGGKIVRRPGTSVPTGELVERATWPVQRAIPPYSASTCKDAIKWAAQVCHRFGITSVQEASTGPATLDALLDLDRTGDLDLHVAAHMVWREEGFGMASSDDLDALIDRADQLGTDYIDTSFIKLWLDGAPLPPHFTESRLDADGNVDRTNILFDDDELHPALIRFDSEGRGIKIHCAAEGSVRVALDAIEAVRKANGPDGPIHEIAHCGFVDEADLPRFKQLNVVAEMSPAIWHRREPEFAVLDAGFKFHTLQQAEARTTIGSDWILTPDPNLFPALQGVLERGEESLPLERALELMTIEGARVVGRDRNAGSLEVGKTADVIVLDRDLTGVQPDQVGATEVLLTLFEGRPVHQAARATATS